jgi:superfamily II DNA or RNA helicase
VKLQFSHRTDRLRRLVMNRRFTRTLARLVVCAVDMFNEGVGLPTLDTVLMLRSTESRSVWLPQFGRGLRVAAGSPTCAWSTTSATTASTS